MTRAWNNLKQNGFKSYMEKSSNDKAREEVTMRRLEACGSDLRDKLIKLFDMLYLTPKVGQVMRQRLYVKSLSMYILSTEIESVYYGFTVHHLYSLHSPSYSSLYVWVYMQVL